MRGADVDGENRAHAGIIAADRPCWMRYASARVSNRAGVDGLERGDPLLAAQRPRDVVEAVDSVSRAYSSSSNGTRRPSGCEISRASRSTVSSLLAAQRGLDLVERRLGQLESARAPT